MFSDECTMQQIAPHHMHISWPLDKCFDKKCCSHNETPAEPLGSLKYPGVLRISGIQQAVIDSKGGYTKYRCHCDG